MANDFQLKLKKLFVSVGIESARLVQPETSVVEFVKCQKLASSR